MFEAFERGADDVVPYAAQSGELAARIRARLDRRAVARADLLRDPVTGALTEESFALLLRRESDRARLLNRPTCLAYLTLHELPEIKARLGQRAYDTVLADVVALVRADVRALDEVGVSDGHLALLLPDTAPRAAQALLNRLVGRVHARAFRVERSAVRLTPAIGVAALEPGSTRPRSSRAR